MKTLLALLMILASTFANAACEIFEDPPVSTANCSLNSVYLPSGSEWTRLYYNPSTIGLNNTGAMSASASVVMSGNDALIGKVEANALMLDGGSVSAGTDLNVWIDVALHRTSSGANSIELLAYRYVSGKLVLENSVATATLGSTATTEFGISYSYASNGTITASVSASGSNQVLAALTVAQFGAVLPSFKLRRGVQPAGSGVVSANFTQNTIL